jgi:hypothetical protein
VSGWAHGGQRAAQVLKVRAVGIRVSGCVELSEVRAQAVRLLLGGLDSGCA